jgi:hypothetical protein
VKKKFNIVIERKQDEHQARCKELPDLIVRGCSITDVCEMMRALIIKKLGGDSDAGSAPVPHPVSPAPRGPIIVEVSHEKPDV